MASTEQIHPAEENGERNESASSANESPAEVVARWSFILTMVGVVLYVGAVLLFGQ